MVDFKEIIAVCGHNKHQDEDDSLYNFCNHPNNNDGDCHEYKCPLRSWACSLKEEENK